MSPIRVNRAMRAVLPRGGRLASAGASRCFDIFRSHESESRVTDAGGEHDKGGHAAPDGAVRSSYRVSMQRFVTGVFEAAQLIERQRRRTIQYRWILRQNPGEELPWPSGPIPA